MHLIANDHDIDGRIKKQLLGSLRECSDRLSRQVQAGVEKNWAPGDRMKLRQKLPENSTLLPHRLNPRRAIHMRDRRKFD